MWHLGFLSSPWFILTVSASILLELCRLLNPGHVGEGMGFEVIK